MEKNKHIGEYYLIKPNHRKVWAKTRQEIIVLAKEYHQRYVHIRTKSNMASSGYRDFIVDTMPEK